MHVMRWREKPWVQARGEWLHPGRVWHGALAGALKALLKTQPAHYELQQPAKSRREILEKEKAPQAPFLDTAFISLQA
jgi:hypothetical protein